MLKAMIFTAAIGAAALFSVSAQALPASPAQPEVSATIIKVAEDCGRGFHRDRAGQCIRNLSPRWPCWWVRGPAGGWRMICR